MLGRFAKRAALLALTGVGLTLASCSSTGFAGSVYMSEDQDGKRNESVFYADYAETKAIYFVVPIVSGKKDESLNTYVLVRQIFGENVPNGSPIYAPILVTSTAPGVQATPQLVVVQFPDPPAVQVLNPAYPLNPLTVQPPRAVGKFQFIASMNGDTEAVNFEILQSNTANQLPSVPGQPPAGACQVGDPSQGGTVQSCPVPTGDHVVQCCTSAQVCGTGVEGTGLCF